MENNLKMVEEFEAIVEIQSPHLMYKKITDATQQRVAISVFSRKPEDVLLMNSTAFENDAVFAGLRLNHIEYLAKNAPREYKEIILKNANDNYFLENVFGIIKKMDERDDLQEKPNQNRFMNVVQYIRDNQSAFSF